MKSFVSNETYASSPVLSSVLVSNAILPAAGLQSSEGYVISNLSTSEESFCDNPSHLIKKLVLEVHGVDLPQIGAGGSHCPGCPAYEAEAVLPVINQVPVESAQQSVDITRNNVVQPNQPIQVVLERLPQPAYAFLQQVREPKNYPIIDGISQPAYTVAEKLAQPSFSLDRFLSNILGTAEQSSAPVQYIYPGSEELIKPQVIPVSQVTGTIPVSISMPVSGVSQMVSPYANAFRTAYQPEGIVQGLGRHHNVMDRLKTLINSGVNGITESRPATFREYLNANFQSPTLIEERDFVLANLNTLKAHFIQDVQPSIYNLRDIATLINDETFYQWMLGAQITPAIRQTIAATAQANKNVMLNEIAGKLLTSQPEPTPTYDNGNYENEDLVNDEFAEFDDGDFDEDGEQLTEFERRLLDDSSEF